MTTRPGSGLALGVVTVASLEGGRAEHAPLSEAFAALGDETRWGILVRLGSGAASASALTRELPITRQAVARHLEVLRAAGLVESERVGRELRYRALGGRVSDVARGLERIADGWSARLAAIKAAAEAPGD